MADIRILLTDKTIAQLSSPNDGWYLARDTELKGFFVVVGKRKRTFTVQGDLRQGGKRASSIRVSIGDTREMSTRTARAIAKEHLAQISQGQHPKVDQRGVQVGAVENAANKPDAQLDVTLRRAWQRYLEAHLVRKGRSETTIEGYRGHVERIFVEWLDIPAPRARNGSSARGTKARRSHKRERAIHGKWQHAYVAGYLQSRSQDQQVAAARQSCRCDRLE